MKDNSVGKLCRKRVCEESPPNDSIPAKRLPKASRVRLFPRGHLRRLSPEKRLCNNAREKRSAPLLYIRSWPTTRLIRVSFIPHMFTFSLSFAMLHTGCEIIFLLKYPFTHIWWLEITRSFLTALRDLFCCLSLVENVQVRILSLYNVKVKINSSIEKIK